MAVDVMAIGAHPDDVELIAGGTVAKLVRKGRSVVIVDLTRGEMGSRGTAETRAQEAREAAGVLGIADRVSLDMGDGLLANTLENRVQVIELMRRFRPTIVLTHHWHDLHPDHCAASHIVQDSMYPVGMAKFPAQGRPYRPNEFLFFMGHFPFKPDIIVDVSEDFDKKLEALGCYVSQLHKPGSTEPETNISQPGFIAMITAQARHYGAQILKAYGEPFAVRRPVPVDDPVALYQPFTKI